MLLQNRRREARFETRVAVEAQTERHTHMNTTAQHTTQHTYTHTTARLWKALEALLSRTGLREAAWPARACSPGRGAGPLRLAVGEGCHSTAPPPSPFIRCFQ